MGLAAWRAYKYYPPHGTWMKDTEESLGQSLLDHGNVEIYQSLNLVVGNEFVRIPSLKLGLNGSKHEMKQQRPTNLRQGIQES